MPHNAEHYIRDLDAEHIGKVVTIPWGDGHLTGTVELIEKVPDDLVGVKLVGREDLVYFSDLTEVFVLHGGRSGTIL